MLGSGAACCCSHSHITRCPQRGSVSLVIAPALVSTCSTCACIYLTCAHGLVVLTRDGLLPLGLSPLPLSIHPMLFFTYICSLILRGYGWEEGRDLTARAHSPLSVPPMLYTLMPCYDAMTCFSSVGDMTCFSLAPTPSLTS